MRYLVINSAGQFLTREGFNPGYTVTDNPARAYVWLDWSQAQVAANVAGSGCEVMPEPCARFAAHVLGLIHNSQDERQRDTLRRMLGNVRKVATM